MYRLVSKKTSKEFIIEHEQETSLSLLYDLSKRRLLHKKRVNKEEVLAAIDSAESIILNQGSVFSIMSLFTVLQTNEKEIKPEGTKQDLIIIENNENLFEKLPEKG